MDCVYYWFCIQYFHIICNKYHDLSFFLDVD